MIIPHLKKYQQRLSVLDLSWAYQTGHDFLSSYTTNNSSRWLSNYDLTASFYTTNPVFRLVTFFLFSASLCRDRIQKGLSGSANYFPPCNPFPTDAPILSEFP